jgi:beta-xylosidase
VSRLAGIAIALGLILTVTHGDVRMPLASTASTVSPAGIPAETDLLRRLEFARSEQVQAAAARGRVPARLPSYSGRLADPAILLDGDTYYAYGTRTGQLDIPVLASNDLATWTAPVNALPAAPEWAERGRTWAPSVVRRGDGYVMWYTTRHRASGRQCISVATASSPLGPFIDSSTQPTICQLDRGGSIDPDVFVDDDGAAFLTWKSEENALGYPTSLWAAPLDANGTRPGEPALLLTRSAEWQGLIIEGPALARAPDGGYFLFYGANNWATPAAAIGYARCATPLGPCTEASTARPWLTGDATALGPSGPQVFRDRDGQPWLAYHAYDLCTGGPRCPRVLFIERLTFIDGFPAAGSRTPRR